ncbi:hypothetical protein SBA7_1430005 [Candidatus Sulfotelmatobacter sp. SbA7]|nr:hypothetical protein SBA7_1430005 [Candidatus Sulfotelmatobacter sp. SbA7]
MRCVRLYDKQQVLLGMTLARMVAVRARRIALLMKISCEDSLK